MKRALFKFALLITVLFTFLMIIIHAQPYDDAQLRSFLLPDNCSAPCLMGIPIHETTAAEAVRILQQNDWVQNIDAAAINENTGHGTISWTWSGKQPAFIDSTLPGTFYSDTVTFGIEDGARGSAQILDAISIQTKLPYWEVYRLLGGGVEKEKWPANAQGYTERIIRASYPDKSLVASAMMDCPATLEKYWNAPVNLVMGFSINARGLLLCPVGIG